MGSDNYSGGSGNLNEDSNMSFPGTQDENSNDADMKLGKSVQVQSCYSQEKSLENDLFSRSEKGQGILI